MTATITKAEKLAAVEVAMSECRRSFPKRIAAGNMTHRHAKRVAEVLLAVAEDYRRSTDES